MIARQNDRIQVVSTGTVVKMIVSVHFQWIVVLQMEAIWKIDFLPKRSVTRRAEDV